MNERGRLEYINPKELHKNPAYTQVVAVTGPVKTIYVGGQDAVTTSGEIVGKGDIGAQTEQVLRNLRAALAAADAEMHHVIKFNIFVVAGQPIQPGFEVFQREWGQRPNPPLITMAFVSALAHPDFLIELEAVAVVPE